MNLTEIYGKNYDKAAIKTRFTALKQTFCARFPDQTGKFFSAGGRVELLGNHTDHNHGKVLVGAITPDTLAYVAPAKDICILSEGYPEITLTTSDLSPKKSEYGSSLGLVRGVLAAFARAGREIGGFCAVMNSTVFKGAGVSSSASFEVLIAEILNVFYNKGEISAVEKAQAAQLAENEFFGKPCGLLDQMGISQGSVSGIDFCDPTSPVISNVHVSLGEYAIYLVNTGGDHADLTDAYAAVRAEMHDVAAYFGKKYLREVDENLFYASIPTLQKAVSGRAILRATHYFNENKRVTNAIAALKEGNLDDFFTCVNASGESSWKLLQNAFTPTDLAQRIPLALTLAKRNMPSGGACRLHGGGFAGTILCFVHRDDQTAFTKAMAEVFGRENIFCADFRAAGACVADWDEQ